MVKLGNRKLLKLVLSCVAVFLSAWVCIGAVESSLTIQGFLKMGDINISLKEYQKDASGAEIPFRNRQRVLPGSVLSKIPRIKNVGRDCYVRARLIFDSDRREIEGIDESNLIGIGSDWRRQGEYYYYEPVLKAGESVDLFEGIQIPAAWDNRHEEQELSLILDVDAVQAENFTPKYQDASPWGDLPIEKCIHESDGQVVSEREQVLLSVYLDGESGKLVSAPEDFFENLPEIMPGDTMEDQIRIQNHTKENMELFFHTSTEGSEEETELLKTLGLDLLLDGSVIYQGNLLSEELEKEISLGSFAPECSSELVFRITAPKEMTNRFAKSSAKVQWNFRTNAAQTGSGNPALGGTGGSVSADVQTGDETPWKFLLVLLAISGILILTVTYCKGGRRKQHEN